MKPPQMIVGPALRPSPFAVVVLAVCLAITALTTYGFHRASRARDQVRFENSVVSVVAQIESRLDTYVALLRATCGVLHLQPQLTRDQFARFVADLQVDRYYPGIHGIGYSERFAAERRADIEARMHAQGLDGFHVWPDHPGDERHTILFLEPLNRGNAAALGFDMSSQPARAEAMARARDTGAPSASGPVTLVQQIGPVRQDGFLIYVPIYASGRTPATVEERRRDLRGFVYSPFVMDDLLSGILGAGPRVRVAFELYDTEARPENLLHRSAARDRGEPLFRERTTIAVGGRTWVVAARSQPGLEIGSNRPLVGYVLGTGLALSGIFFGLAQARSRKQEQLRIQARVLESMGEGVSVVDQQGRILYTNPAEDRIFGYAPGELVGKHVTQLNTYDPEQNARVVHDVMEELRVTGKWLGEFSNVKKDGTAFPTLACITSVEIAGGTYLVSVQEDITDRKRVELERTEILAREQAARAEAEAASRAKDEFLAVLGHELRNPLSPIVSALELMQRRGVKGVDRELELIDRQVRHMVRLIDDLLDVSRIARGKIRIKKTPIEISRVISHAIEIASPLLEQHSHRLVVDVPEQGLLVDADSGRLSQVVANLLTNAAKFTDPGGRIEVTALGEADEVMVRVRDNGRGITAELLPTVFELFAQGGRGSQAAAAPGGLGIGLTLVKTLVALHGGEVSAASEGPGRGTEVTIRLPVSQRRAAEVEAPRPAELPESRSHRILVVDDNEDAAEMLSELLRAKGHAVEVAHDGFAALEMAERFDFDVGVFDIGLPAMDGYELAERMQEQHHARLIAVTGYGQAHDVERAQQAGFLRHFVKPVDFSQLLTAIESLPPPP